MPSTSTTKAQTPSLSGSDAANGLANLLRRCPHFRGKARLQGWLLPRSGVERASVFGLEMELDLGDLIQRDIYAGLYEPFETRFIRKFLRPGMTVVDVGANVGYYTWLAAGLVEPAGRVLAIEPGPYAFDRLQRVIRANRLDNVECRQMALSDYSGRGTLYVPRPIDGNYNPSFNPYLSGMDSVDVTVERLDHVLDAAGLGRVDLMKVDVEGHELRVFRGAGRAIRDRRIGAILCEFNEGCQVDSGWTCAELERWFAESGFTLARKFPSKWGARVHNRLYVAAL